MQNITTIVMLVVLAITEAIIAVVAETTVSFGLYLSSLSKPGMYIFGLLGGGMVFLGMFLLLAEIITLVLFILIKMMIMLRRNKEA